MGAMRVSVMIMSILACAAFLSKAMAYTGIPREMALWIKAMGLSPVMLIASLTVVYIILGTALDGVSMIVLTTAVVIPMVQAAGINLIWFGIFVVLLVEISEVTPPVGFNLYVLQAMSGRDSTYVARAAIPFFFLLVLSIALITLFPDIVMWLPDRVIGADAVKKPG
jgi:TRAP-type C4-dicarboxylate transport system permease large subunit